MVSGLQAVSQSRRQFEVMPAACRKLVTQSVEQPVGPEGRARKRTVAALHFLPRATAITDEVRLAPARFGARRDRMPLIRGALEVLFSHHANIDSITKFLARLEMRHVFAI